MIGGHKGAACLERDVGVLNRAEKRQWPDAGISRVTRGGLVYIPYCVGDHILQILVTLTFFLFFMEVK